jgi:hypothetical protein
LPYGYFDSDYAGDSSNSKSTSGHVFFLSDAAFAWSSKKQSTVATSTAEAEYIALHHAGQQAAWIRSFYEEIGLPLSVPLEIKCDNEAAIAIVTGGDAPHKKMKHVRVKYHFTREQVERNEISVVYVRSEDNLADQFTKSLSPEHFEDQSNALGFYPTSDLLPSPPTDTSLSLYEDAPDTETRGSVE